MGTFLERVHLESTPFLVLASYSVPSQARFFRRFLVAGTSAPLPRLNIEISGTMFPVQYVFEGVILKDIYSFSSGRISEQWQWVGKPLVSGTSLNFHMYGGSLDVLLEFDT